MLFIPIKYFFSIAFFRVKSSFMSGSCKKANDKNSKLHLKTTLLKVDFYQNDFILPLLLYRNKILYYF